MNKYEVTGIYGSNSALLVLGKESRNKRIFYKVQCQICKNDPDLHGEAIYFISSDYFKNGKLPCGCSNNIKYSKEQWNTILLRKAIENNHEFIGYVAGEYVNQNTKLKLHCNSCGNNWESCSVSNYIRNRDCPECSKVSKACKKSTPDYEWERRFRETGMFPEEQYSFKRVTNTGRLWKVKCSKCSEKEFISDRSNLVAGKIPCDCTNKGGFDVSMTGYFYILYVNLLGKDFIKFGISNFPKRRLVSHIRTLNSVGGTITKKLLFKGCGKEVLRVESELKRNLQIENKFIEGFKREACSSEYIQDILNLLVNLEAVEETPV